MQAANAEEQQNHQGFNGAFGFDAMGVPFSNNANFGGDFNSMQAMMSMQNGMMPNNFNFSMMGAYLACFCLARGPRAMC